VRIKPALFALGIFEAVEFDGTLPYPDRAETADAARIAEQFAFDAEPLLAVMVDHKPRPALAVLGIDVFVPEIERLQNVAVGIDSVVGASHHPSPFGCA
jgi:hypothetical protein